MYTVLVNSRVPVSLQYYSTEGYQYITCKVGYLYLYSKGTVGYLYLYSTVTVGYLYLYSTVTVGSYISTVLLQ